MFETGKEVAYFPTDAPYDSCVCGKKFKIGQTVYRLIVTDEDRGTKGELLICGDCYRKYIKKIRERR